MPSNSSLLNARLPINTFVIASNSLLEGLVFSHRAAKIINNSINDIELLTKSVDKVNKTVDEIAAKNKKLVVAAIKQQGGRIDD